MAGSLFGLAFDDDMPAGAVAFALGFVSMVRSDEPSIRSDRRWCGEWTDECSAVVRG